MNYEVGSRVGDYEVLQVLGAGGMGRVYKVRNAISDRVEAMKVLLPNLEGNIDLANRFMREIKTQASLDHPNIAALHTALRVDDQLLMLMEYVEGVTLESMMAAGPVSNDKAVDYMAQVLSALSYAHAHGVVHRDLKPANIMITANGAVKLMDFGIARMQEDRKLTQTGQTVGSLYYMSPEQIKGAGDLDARSDLYSLGVCLYEVCTGARPFQGDSEYSIMAAHLQSNPPPPIQLSPNLSPDLSEIILLALEKDPAKRFQTADAMRSALLSVNKPAQAAAASPLAAPVPQPSPTVAPPVPPVSRPAAPAAAPAHAAAVAPMPPPGAARSHRGLWIAVGSLVTVAVLVVIATQIPAFRHVAAQVVPQNTAPAVAPAVVSQPPASSPAIQPAAVEPASQTTAAPAPAGNPVPHRAIPPNSSQPAARQPAAQSPVSAPPVSQSTEPPSVPPLAPMAGAAETAKPDTRLKEVRHQYALLGVRARTVQTGLDNLRRQQARSGLGLRADMTASEQRMEHYLDEADAAVKGGDTQAAKENIEAAEREVSKLENFLGH
jgi:serine/threonine-protein kinase